MATRNRTYLDWVDALKAFAILGILLNHLVEEFGPGPWFTNPNDRWPDLATRLQNILPPADNWLLKAGTFLGWLGDSGPGVFILLSGFGLTLSALRKGEQHISVLAFYRRRLLRIFPLYIAIHLLTFVGLAFFPGHSYSAAHPYALFSLAGLRFNSFLFFYINPSWWFIWLILQLYLVYPFLYRLLQKSGLRWFLGLTLGVTLLSRSAGLLDLPYTGNLYYWMTGIFFGTRLAEFAAGMALAFLFVRQPDGIKRQLKLSRVGPWSVAIYLGGVLCSFFWIGTLVSNLLVSIGLSGLFYTVWEGVIKKSTRWLVRPILWIGATSFGVYLLHQAPLQWTAEFTRGWSHLLAAVAVLAISFPAALGIERLVGLTQRFYLGMTTPGPVVRMASALTSVLMLGAWRYLDPDRLSNTAYQLAAVMMLTAVIGLILLAFRSPVKKHLVWHFLILTAALTSVIKLYLLPFDFFYFSILLGAAAAFLITFFGSLTGHRAFAWVGTALFVGLLVGATEIYLRRSAPLETLIRWGEYPALEAHPTRVYGLKPNRKTHLRYNNYDYVLKTNSFGLAAPEISSERQDTATLRILIIGDAFSMPEGMAYESAYPYLLEAQLRKALAPQPVEVINGGVTGYGPNEQEVQLSELLPVFEPDIVLYQFFINEFHEIQLSPEERLANIGLTSELSGLQTVIYNSQVLAYGEKTEQDLLAKLKGRDPAYRYRKALLAYYEKDNPRYYDEATIQEMDRTLRNMQGVSASSGARFLLAYVPGQVEVSAREDIAYFPRRENLQDTSRFDLDQPWRYASRLAADAEIPVINLTPHLRASPEQPVYFPESWHWNPVGHSLVARVLAEEILKMENRQGLIREVPLPADTAPGQKIKNLQKNPQPDE